MQFFHRFNFFLDDRPDLFLLLVGQGQGLGHALDASFDSRHNLRPLAAFRIGLAAVLLVQAGLVAGSLGDLYGSRGIVQWSVTEGMAAPGVPR